MAKGNGIIVTAKPKGVYHEGIIRGTPKPGIVVEPKSIAADGTITWEAAGTTANNSTFSGMSASGDRCFIGVLLCSQDHAACPLNQDNATAYTDGDRCAVYSPAEGEHLNMIYKDISGTGANQDLFAGLTRLMVDDGTGKLDSATSSPQNAPFLSMETKADIAADYLLEVMYTGR